MIITRTPFRMSFFGGGTDYPAWFREHGGAVLATTMDKYCYISVRYLPPFFGHRSRIVYSRIENVMDNAAIEHPAVRGVLAHLGVSAGLEIHHDGDLPAKTGLGSSSAFTVGLLHAVRTLRGEMTTKMALAREAIHIEQHVLNESVGCQDQVLTAFGGLVRVDFGPGDEIQVSPVVLTRDRVEEFQQHLMLYFTGFSRIASQVAELQISRTAQLAPELTAMHQMVDEAQSRLCGSRDIGDVGRLLHDGWMLKRSLTNKIATEAIDEIYDTARRAGVIGGKLMGAGGGGFMVLFARPGDQPRVREALRGLLEVPFRFDRSGTQIVVYEPGEREAPDAAGQAAGRQ